LALDMAYAPLSTPASAFPMDIYTLMSVFVLDIGGGLLHLLKLSKDKVLDSREQILCVEIASFMTVALKAMPNLILQKNEKDTIVSANKPKEVQKDTIRKVLDWMVRPVIIRLFIAMILYDLQMDLGGGARNTIEEGFVRQAYSKTGMKDKATYALVELLVRCPQIKYDVLEVFSVAEVFLRQSVRPCYMAELLMDVSMGTYLLRVQEFLRSFAKKEGMADSGFLTVLNLRRVETMDNVRPGFMQRMFCVTAQKVFMLMPPEEKPLYASASDLGGRWQPSGELVFPRDPKVEWHKDCNQIKVLHKCYSSQLMGIEWKSEVDNPRVQDPRADKSASTGLRVVPQRGAAPPSAQALQDSPKDCVLLIFPRVTARDECINVLRMHSGHDHKTRAPIEKDKGIRDEVLHHNKINDDTGLSVLAVNVALAKPSTLLGFDVAGGTTFEPKLFVLTKSYIVVFKLNLLNWQPQRPNPGEDFEIDDFRPSDLFPPPPGYAGATVNRQTINNTAMLAAAVAADAQKLRQALKPVLTEDSTAYDVSGIKSVTFETSAEADLSLMIGTRDLKIRFYDDSARETWRRALAYILWTKKGKTWKRSMDAGDTG